LSVDISNECLEKLRRAQRLIGSRKNKNLTMNEALDEILQEYLKKNDPYEKAKQIESRTLPEAQSVRSKSESKSKFANQARGNVPTPTGGAVRVLKRYIPAKIQREIWLKNKGQCSFMGIAGERCASTTGLQIHHHQPWALGGKHKAQNLDLL